MRNAKIKKRIFVFILAIAMSVLFLGCNVVKTPIPEDKGQYRIDFENANIERLDACFDEEFAPQSVSIADGEAGFSGKVFKAKVTLPSPDRTWWISGIKFLNDKTDLKERYINLQKITFKYKSTVDYSLDVPFIMQFVWKSKANEQEIASIWTEFLMEKTADVKTYEIIVEKEVTELLNTQDDYYLDWIMVGLEGDAGEFFKKGVFYIDDITFFGNDKA